LGYEEKRINSFWIYEKSVRTDGNLSEYIFGRNVIQGELIIDNVISNKETYRIEINSSWELLGYIENKLPTYKFKITFGESDSDVAMSQSNILE
jgi:hypothetical protein